MSTESFTLCDLRRQLISIAHPGVLKRILWWMVTLFRPREIRAIFDDPEVKTHCRQVIGIIDAMTPAERLSPKSIDRYRLIRIANGAGVSLHDVQCVLGMYEGVKAARLRLPDWRKKRNDDEPI